MNKDIAKRIIEARNDLIQIRTQLMISPSKKDENSIEYQELLKKLKEAKERMSDLLSDEQRMKEGKNNGKH